jgi:uncharacterized protein
VGDFGGNMLEIIRGILGESLKLFIQMSPYLLFGFLFAGLLHVFVSLDWIARHLGKSSFGSVVKAVILGIPLPLCSCGVIPAAIALRKKGASRGATISFLIATPITGVDSILATYSLLGLFFTIFRIVAASIAAFVAGVLSNILIRHEHVDVAGEPIPEESCPHCRSSEPSRGDAAKGGNRLMELFHYAFVELLGDIWKWLVFGILIGGLISYLLPGDFIHQYLGMGWLSMIVMLIIGIPMYVCSTGSIPIAASLMLKGLSPGAALVFLLAGPATNAVTITVVARELGKKAATLYVLTIAVMSVLAGALLNAMWNTIGEIIPHVMAPMNMLPRSVDLASAIILAFLIMVAMIKGLAGHKH